RQAARGEQLHDLCVPQLVVVKSQIFRRRKKFPCLATCISIPFAPGPERGPDGLQASLPARMKHRLGLLRLDRTEVLHPAHVVDAVHPFVPSLDGTIMPTPIMESRVTNAASASSLNPSVPAGRSGNTR